jgi:hypothetical protein
MNRLRLDTSEHTTAIAINHPPTAEVSHVLQDLHSVFGGTIACETMQGRRAWDYDHIDPDIRGLQYVHLPQTTIAVDELHLAGQRRVYAALQLYREKSGTPHQPLTLEVGPLATEGIHKNKIDPQGTYQSFTVPPQKSFIGMANGVPGMYDNDELLAEFMGVPDYSTFISVWYEARQDRYTARESLQFLLDHTVSRPDDWQQIA